jgi:molybdopterin molybdotransferase
MINYLEALEIIKKEISELPVIIEEVDLLESFNRVLAEDVIADVDLPPFNNSAMDGYAIKFSDRKLWTVIGEIKAGNFQDFHLSASDAVLITTGAKVPKHADTIIPVEDVIQDSNQIRLRENARIKLGNHIRLKGNDLEKNKTAVSKFTKISSSSVTALASCGKSKVNVYRKLKIGILATGDELVPIDESPAEDKIRVSNSYALSFAAKEINQTAINYGMVKDESEVIKAQIQKMISDDNDLIITTGSVSVGKYDLVKEIFKEVGVDIKFWKVNIKPGKPIVFGIYSKSNNKKLIFGLPGNPVSCLVSFKIFIEPAIKYFYHQTEDYPLFAELEKDLIKKDNKRHFMRGTLCYSNKLKVKALPSQSSGNLVEMSRANCLIEIPEEKENPKCGEVYRCIKI